MGGRGPRQLLRLCGITVICMGLVPIVWNILGWDPVDRSEGLSIVVDIFFGLMAVGLGVMLLSYARTRSIEMARWRYGHALVALLVNAGVLAFLATAGPITLETALAAFPILLGLCLVLPFSISPRADWEPPTDVQSQRRTLRRIALGYGVMAAFAAAFSSVVAVFGTLTSTTFMLPMAAMFLTLALLNWGESQNPQPWASSPRTN